MYNSDFEFCQKQVFYLKRYELYKHLLTYLTSLNNNIKIVNIGTGITCRSLCRWLLNIQICLCLKLVHVFL